MSSAEPAAMPEPVGRADSAYPVRPASVWSYRPGPESSGFPRTSRGRRGYDEGSVDSFVQQVVKDRAAADGQISDLRAEIDRLHRYIRRQWAAVAAAESAGTPASGRAVTAGGPSPAMQARTVLSQAQEIAERRLAQADARLSEAEHQAAARLTAADRQVQIKLVDADRRVSRLIGAGEDAAAQRLTRVDLIAEQVLIKATQDATRRRAQAEEAADQVLRLARARHEDIVVRAHQRADRAAEVALAEIQSPVEGSRARAELEMKAAYLRTFAKVSRAELQAALEITGREFDRLLGGSASAGPASHRSPVASGLDDPDSDRSAVASASAGSVSDRQPASASDRWSASPLAGSGSDRLSVAPGSPDSTSDPALALVPAFGRRRAAHVAPPQPASQPRAVSPRHPRP